MDMLTKNDIDRWEDDGGRASRLKALAVLTIVGIALAIRDFWQDRRREKWIGTVAGLIIVVLASLMVAGCGADSDQRTRQTSEQATITPTANTQATDTQGTNLRFTWTNSSPGVPMLDGGPAFASSQPSEFDDPAMVEDYNATIASAGHKRSRMGYQQTNIFTITTGGTAPTVTGSATGTGSGAQNPAQDGKQDQTQTTRAGVTANLANTPGGVANQSGASAAGEGNAQNTQDNQVDQRIAKLEAAAAQNAQAIGAVLDFLRGNQGAAPKPTTMPAGE